MADSKKYNGSTWEHSLRKLTTSTDTITTFPAGIYADGNNATVGISGNTVQNGTPTPDNPIMPQGCGERTENLCNPNLTRYEKAYAPTGGGIIDFAGGATYLLPIEANSTYTVKIYSDESIRLVRVGLYNEDTPINGTFVTSLQQINGLPNPTITVENTNYKYIYLQIGGEYIDQYGLSHVMLNSGSTAKPYEPYGYKISVSSANTTTPVYLGEAETTRKIKKLVLTGEENWSSLEQSGVTLLRCADSLIGKQPGKSTDTMICTALRIADGRGNCASTPNSMSVYNMQTDHRMVVNTNGLSAQDWQTYLQQQYAAGTPVTVWYVLSSATTGIVNEPLRKIGDYADTVSGISIPTITSKDTFDVETTLKPSEVELTYTGWHDAEVKEFDGSEWE